MPAIELFRNININNYCDINYNKCSTLCVCQELAFHISSVSCTPLNDELPIITYVH